MALSTNLPLITLFGSSATGGAENSSGTLSVSLTQLGTGGDVTTPAALTAEGIILALMQKWNDAQGSDAARILELTRATPTITTRGGETVRTERYTITIYSNSGIDVLDPDTV